MDEKWLIFLIVGVILGAFLANLYRSLFPELFDLAQFVVWYQNNVIERRIGQNRIALGLSNYLWGVLEARGLIEHNNIFDMYGWLADNDKTDHRLYFMEADAIMDRYLIRQVDSVYTLNRLAEIKQQFESATSQESQGV